MIKNVTLFALLILAANLDAQSIFGFKGGLNFSKLEFSDFNRDRTSFHAGMFIEFPTKNSKVFVQPELLFNIMGGKDSDFSEYQLALNYLSVPVVGKYYIAPKLYAEAGPQINLLLSGIDLDKDEGEKEDVSEYLNRFDVGLSLGGGYKLTDKFGLSFRYYIGLRNILTDDWDDTGKNRAFHLTAAFNF